MVLLVAILGADMRPRESQLPSPSRHQAESSRSWKQSEKQRGGGDFFASLCQEMGSRAWEPFWGEGNASVL